MFTLPSGMRFILFLIVLALGICNTFSFADYSIGTIIETTGMVHDSFTGNWNTNDGNVTNDSGIYKDMEMTNGGNFSVNKQISMMESTSTGTSFSTQKEMSYSSGESGAHLLADEFMLMSSEKVTNTTSGKICFSDPHNDTSFVAHEELASFTITNAKELTLSSGSRYADGVLDYSISAGSPANNSTIGIDGTIQTRFEGKTLTGGRDIRLYDRTLISGLIESFNRIYHGGDTQDLTGFSSGTGSMTDKTIVTEKYVINKTGSDSLISGTAVYSSDMMTNGGKTQETRQVTGSEGISAERVITYQSDGNRSIQASEHAVTTSYLVSDGYSSNEVCVFAKPTSESDDYHSPYSEASAQTGISGISSAQISSITKMSDPSGTQDVNLEYRADISIPIGFNTSFVQEMKDTDEDGKYEDVNGNGHLDMHDLVLLFQNFRWIGESNISTRIDFNKNGHADYADIVTAFRAMNQT